MPRDEKHDTEMKKVHRHLERFMLSENTAHLKTYIAWLALYQMSRIGELKEIEGR